MTKIRKVKRRKRFRTNINRKRLRNKLRRLPPIKCPQLKDAWEVTLSTRVNMKQMGLSYDPNEALKIPNTKRELIDDMKRKINNENVPNNVEQDVEMVPVKSHVAEELEAEANAPRKRMFRLPNNLVHFLIYLLDTYGEDYKAMARDKKNYNQLTWRQMRAKIKTFKGIPEQYNEYLKIKNMELSN